MKLDDSVQPIRAKKPSNRKFATYGITKDRGASLWASPNPEPGKSSYFWLELESEEATDITYRVFSSRAKIRTEEWQPMKPAGSTRGNPFEPACRTFKATQRLQKGRYVLQARFQIATRTIELPGVTFGVA